jgi:hypothetical protein
VTGRLMRRGGVWILVALFLAGGGFALGFAARPRLKYAIRSDLRRPYLSQKGDAPETVRLTVLDSLRAFQDGYTKRDPKELDPFMHRLFSENEDVLLTGTDQGEWAHGYPAVAAFIKADWLNWGDLKLNVDDSIIWSAGDTAWLASIGVVHDGQSDRPLHFGAVLNQKDGHWVFRQLHFQWDEREPRFSDLLNPGVSMRLVGLVVQGIFETRTK